MQRPADHAHATVRAARPDRSRAPRRHRRARTGRRVIELTLQPSRSTGRPGGQWRTYVRRASVRPGEIDIKCKITARGVWPFFFSILSLSISRRFCNRFLGATNGRGDFHATSTASRLLPLCFLVPSRLPVACRWGPGAGGTYTC